MKKLHLFILAFFLFNLNWAQEIGNFNKNLTYLNYLDETVKLDPSDSDPEVRKDSNKTFFVDGTKGYFR